MKSIIILLMSILLFVGCKKNDSSNDSSNDSVNEYKNESSEEFSDGEYCAEIDYYNSETGNSSTYTLSVEVENSELVKIEWSNGGWLDSSHFSPPDISDGTATFEDDRGREFEVKLLEKGSCNNSSSLNEDGESTADDNIVDEDEFSVE